MYHVKVRPFSHIFMMQILQKLLLLIYLAAEINGSKRHKCSVDHRHKNSFDIFSQYRFGCVMLFEFLHLQFSCYAPGAWRNCCICVSNSYQCAKKHTLMNCGGLMKIYISSSWIFLALNGVILTLGIWRHFAVLERCAPRRALIAKSCPSVQRALNVVLFLPFFHNPRV